MSNNKTKDGKKNTKKTESRSDKAKMLMVPITIVCGIIASIYYNTWLSGLVNSPLNEPRIIDESSYTSAENQDRYWGSYR